MSASRRLPGAEAGVGSVAALGIMLFCGGPSCGVLAPLYTSGAVVGLCRRGDSLDIDGKVALMVETERVNNR